MNAGLLLTVLLGMLALFQLALALSAPLGRFAWGGQHRVLPGRLRIGSALSIAVYALIALIALDREGTTDAFPDAISTVGIWVVFGYFVIGIGMNAISPSKPERYVMVPVAAMLAALTMAVALQV